MLIGELAERTGVPPKTLRYYEHVGVLSAPERSTNGYRRYGEEALGRLEFVRAAQAAGLTLADIRSIVQLREDGMTPCAHVIELIDDKRAQLDSQLADLHRLRSELDDLRGRAERVDPTSCDPRLVCEVLVARRDES
jgi:MerR family copper efflux transcriptional regulator